MLDLGKRNNLWLEQSGFVYCFAGYRGFRFVIFVCFFVSLSVVDLGDLNEGLAVGKSF